MSDLRTYSYKVAGLTFTVAAPESFDIERLLPSFAPFRVPDIASAGSVTGTDKSLNLSKGLRLRLANESDGMVFEPEMLFRFTLQAEAIGVPEDAKVAEVDDNDMGHTRLSRTADGGYCLELWYDHCEEMQATGGKCGNSAPAYMAKATNCNNVNNAQANQAWANGSVLPRPGIFIANAGFTDITASIEPDSPDCGLVLTSMLRIAFAQSVLSWDGVSIHASAVSADGKAWLFLGKSGTGKSTHARLWLRNIPGARLLNDDNPAVRLVDGKAFAFGTPWSGKTPCYRNESYPVGGIVRLVRGDADIFTKKDEVEALVALLPSCSVVHSDTELQSRLCDTLAAIAGAVPVGELKCLPDDEAATLCFKNLKSLIK